MKEANKLLKSIGRRLVRQTDGRTDRPTDRQTDGRTDRQTPRILHVHDERACQLRMREHGAQTDSPRTLNRVRMHILNALPNVRAHVYRQQTSSS
jgi:hypothetical protein